MPSPTPSSLLLTSSLSRIGSLSDDQRSIFPAFYSTPAVSDAVADNVYQCFLAAIAESARTLKISVFEFRCIATRTFPTYRILPSPRN